MNRRRRTDGFITRELRKKLLADMRNQKIFNEADLQSRTYLHLDKFLGDERRVLNKPTLRIWGGRHSYPDLVIVNGEPVYAIELKIAMGNSLPTSQAERDLRKLRKFRSKGGKLSKGFFLVVHDGEASDLPCADDQEWKKQYLFVVEVNVRISDSGRQRRGYYAWRKRWDELA